MSLTGLVITVLLIFLLLGVLPAWPYSRGWGYYPTAGIGTILVVILLLWLVFGVL